MVVFSHAKPSSCLPENKILKLSRQLHAPGLVHQEHAQGYSGIYNLNKHN